MQRTGAGGGCGVHEGLLLCRLRNVKACLHSDSSHPVERGKCSGEKVPEARRVLGVNTWDVDLR